MFAAAAIGLTPLVASAASAEGADNARTELLLAHVEKRASATSFAALEDFGHEAIARIDVDGLRRVQHVLNIYLNNSELERARFWNGHLASNAALIDNRRYKKLAELNEMMIAYRQGDRSQAARMRQVMDSTSDWYVRLNAVRYFAVTRFTITRSVRA